MDTQYMRILWEDTYCPYTAVVALAMEMTVTSRLFAFLVMVMSCHWAADALRVEVTANPLTLDENNPLSLSCFVYFSRRREASVVSWTKNERPLLIDGDHVTASGIQFLYIAKARADDSGLYRCTAKTARDAASGTAQVTVRAVVTIRPVLKHVSALVGSQALLECKGENLRNVKWFHKWKSIKKSSKFQMMMKSGKGSLNISDVSMSDAGSYQCQSATASAVVQLAVKQPIIEEIPQLVVRLESRQLVQSAIITCHFAPVYQEAVVTWSKDKADLNVDLVSSRYSLPSYIGGAALLIEKVTCSDNGVYTCSVYANGKIIATSRTMLQVEGPPEPPISVAVEIACTEGIGGLRVSWFSSPCSNNDGFTGYEVTMTVLSTNSISIVGDPIIARTGSDMAGIYIALIPPSSCSNCDLVFDVKVRAVSVSGQSEPVSPLSVSNKGTGRICADAEDSSSVLLSLPGIQLGMFDSRCSCAKSSQALNIKELVKDFVSDYIKSVHQNLTGGYLTLTSESVWSTDDALSGFIYRAKLNNVAILNTVNSISRISVLMNSDRRRQKEFKVAERCKLKFADCSALFVENRDNFGCDVKKKCSIPSSLDRRRKWCQ